MITRLFHQTMPADITWDKFITWDYTEIDESGWPRSAVPIASAKATAKFEKTTFTSPNDIIRALRLQLMTSVFNTIKEYGKPFVLLTKQTIDFSEIEIMVCAFEYGGLR